ncbi:hypothetical protein NHP21011_12600 [Helicobacter heilmannii]|uniref:hypothetical protein n=1 Tax=Helicobacter heilmannii TaxID=35817 RepID=UPI00244D85D5|nr:hypothetical protein [Helicobacter heilmannii]GMB95161.1 hypothetical protein NHP21011_12600 [Helicobacter heilmannii]
MLQKVKNISYLCKVPFGLDEEEKQLAILPNGAEIVSLSLEVVHSLSGCSVDIGLKEDPEFFFSGVDCGAKEVEDSSKPFCALKNEVIIANIKGFKEKKKEVKKPVAKPAGSTAEPIAPAKPAPKEKEEEEEPLCIFRMQYFLPSEITLEV